MAQRRAGAIYLKGVKPESGEQADSDLREIVFKKSNYGPLSEKIIVQYRDGLLLPLPGVASLDRAANVAALHQGKSRGERQD